eukprot:776471-Rhodomonas_salina.1
MRKEVEKEGEQGTSAKKGKFEKEASGSGKARRNEKLEAWEGVPTQPIRQINLKPGRKVVSSG